MPKGCGKEIIPKVLYCGDFSRDEMILCRECRKGGSMTQLKDSSFVSHMNEYQVKAMETADYPQQSNQEAFSYLGMGLAGEAGEVANKLKKFLRGDYELTPDKREDIAYEIGDCMWYLSELSRQLGFDLATIASANIDKLASRKERGAIKGNGDSR